VEAIAIEEVLANLISASYEIWTYQPLYIT